MFSGAFVSFMHHWRETFQLPRELPFCVNWRNTFAYSQMLFETIDRKSVPLELSSWSTRYWSNWSHWLEWNSVVLESSRLTSGRSRFGINKTAVAVLAACSFLSSTSRPSSSSSPPPSSRSALAEFSRVETVTLTRRLFFSFAASGR